MDRHEQEPGTLDELPDFQPEKPGFPLWQHVKSTSRSFTMMEAGQVLLQAGGEIDKDPAAGLYLDLVLERELVGRAGLLGHGRLGARVESTLWLDAGVYEFSTVWRSDRPLGTVHQFWMARPDIDQDPQHQYKLSLACNGGPLFTRLSFGHPAQVRAAAVYEAELLEPDSKMELWMYARALPSNSVQSLGYDRRANGRRIEKIQLAKTLSLPPASPYNGVWQIETVMESRNARPSGSGLALHIR
ncbi:hypothetical protein [Massilia endophytica]|uniref:hypothetical protein n=1 Tax=Massilia endophytica TaxID=2899220 RepID=UPI001E541D49|nr:hypothetical protein [Massilia endophytica]UGQ48571.1 hypothetical protein LSQ66_08970 [Massilia endophytica]